MDQHCDTVKEAPPPTTSWMESHNIPVFWGNRMSPALNNNEGRVPTRRVIRRDEGLVKALTLPTISVYNMRSIWAKIKNLGDDINMRETDICFLTEIWQKQENKKHRFKIEELLEMKGIQYISTPRPGARRGGGVAIAFPGDKYQVSKLNIDVVKPLECLFSLVKTTNPAEKCKRYIAVCFYCPPSSKSKTKLVDLISTHISSLRTQYADCGVIVCGDRNDLEMKQLLSVDPSLRQIVDFPTNKKLDKTLDVVLTDMFSSYQAPTRLPAIPVDIGSEGVPSDHWGVEVKPRTNLSTTKARPKKENILVRRMPDSLVAKFGPILAVKDWSFLAGLSPDRMVQQFEEAATGMVDQMFPKKKVQIIEGDQPFFTEELRQLRRQRNRAYQRDGRSANYFSLQTKFQDKLKHEAQKYKAKILEDVTSGKRGSGYSAIRKLAESSANREQRKEFIIPAYEAEGLKPLQAAQRSARHFSAISQTVAPLNINNFHPALLNCLPGRKFRRVPPGPISLHSVSMKYTEDY